MKELEHIYKKRKHQLLPIIFGFCAFFVFFRIILPQWGDIQEVLSLMSTKSKVVKAKEDTVTLLNSVPLETVDRNYQLATTALPPQKDVILIYDELNLAASKAGVKLGGFSVKIGGLYSSEANKKSKEKLINGVPFINILVNVSGESDGLRLFATELYKSIPLVEIVNIDISRKGARYDANFYYKPAALRASNADTTPLTGFSQIETNQLKELATWNSSITQ